ncbi:MAG: hypothetical protein ACE37F_16825 [Nannocystaceae bacterium]|nr:hypothetical protein [bacterium]
MFGLSVGDLGRLKDFASPSFFEVLPARALWTEGRKLLASRRDREGFDALLEQLRPIASGPPVGVELVDQLGESSDELGPRARGASVLALYFAQLAHLDAAALDLRHAHFRGSPTALLWAPQPLFARWSPEFIEGIRDLYAGFYRDDDARFHGAAERLKLTPALDLFVKHFGEGDQRNVTFEMETFKDSFHAIFVRCKDAGETLDPGFIGLGIMLSTLYEHLSTLGVPLDVRAAFEAAWPS